MKISAKRRSMLYGAIHEGSMQVRLRLQRHPDATEPQRDYVVACGVEETFNLALEALEGTPRKRGKA